LVLFDWNLGSICVLFIYLAVIAYFRSQSLGADDFENLQELDFRDFEQQPAGEQGK
jgi:hypothetical protein